MGYNWAQYKNINLHICKNNDGKIATQNKKKRIKMRTITRGSKFKIEYNIYFNKYINFLKATWSCKTVYRIN